MPLSLSHPDSTYPASGNLSGVPPWDTTAAPDADPAEQAAGGGGGLITGIAAAAGYLGYDKADSFRRARTRHPIPGETRTSHGRPAWTPDMLRNWRAQRNAGNHPADRDTEQEGHRAAVTASVESAGLFSAITCFAVAAFPAVIRRDLPAPAAPLPASCSGPCPAA